MFSWFALLLVASSWSFLNFSNLVNQVGIFSWWFCLNKDFGVAVYDESDEGNIVYSNSGVSMELFMSFDDSCNKSTNLWKQKNVLK